ncbi:MAG: type II toxin-antitoxin system RelB/DinJ family antitoxin [Selenomonadaceae bacterium]|nr:type II toxin-antitoxin system RelB/DinJ family antitoxin [Selenomonadaceae bacterium]
MAQAMVNFRLDTAIKQSFEETCQQMGLTMTSVLTMFATKVSREKRIPFEITADPFYSKENMAHLEKIIKGIENGTVKLVQHDLIEV